MPRSVFRHLSLLHATAGTSAERMWWLLPVPRAPGGTRQPLGSRASLELVWWGEQKPAFRVGDSRMKWDLVAVLIRVLL